MNYIQLTQDSLRLFRNTKLIWVLGFISSLAIVALSLSPYAQDSFIYLCIYLPICLIIGVLSLVAEGSLIYVIYQASLNQDVTFAEAWLQGKSRTPRIIGFVLLTLPIMLLSVGIYIIVAIKAPTSFYLLPIVLIIGAFVVSLFTFGMCAIMIDDTKVGEAAWTGFLISINNFFYAFATTGIIFFIRACLIYLVVLVLSLGLFGIVLPIPLELNYSTYQKLLGVPIIAFAGWLFDLFFVPFTTIILTLGYFEFTKRISYPALEKRRNAA